MKFSRILLAIMVLFSFNSVFSQTNDGEESTSNKSFVNRAPGDYDDDGVLDTSDIDNDNDGIIDSYECSVSIQFDTPTLLTATDLSDLLIGEKVVYSNALLFQNQYYDIVLTLTSISGSVTVDVNTELEVIGFNPDEDEYVTYSFDLVEAGSATVGNPTGTPVSLNNIIIGLQDLDHSVGQDYTEIFGYNSVTVTSSINGYLNPTTSLEAGGFINGAAPADFSLFRLNPAISGSATDWTDEPNDTSPFTPEFTVFMEFDVFSHVDLILGVTGTEESVGLRHTHFLADSNCDDDNDNISNKFDIDSDNDGIPDNVEAQPTNFYVLPSTTVDAVTGIPTSYGSGLIPEDTDNDNTPDFIDTDTDNDGTPDIQENGILADNIVLIADDDNDGLDNLFETNGVNDPVLDVNEDIEDPTDLSILSDTDGDLALGGDLDYRDALDVYYESATIDFDGVDDYVDSAFDFSGMTQATVMTWIKLDPSFSANGVIIAQGDFLLDVASNGRISTSVNNGTIFLPSANALQVNQWYHVAVIYNNSIASDKLKLYINGVLIDTNDHNSLADPMVTSADNFTIGKTASNDNSYFKGAIDEVRVFDVALTENQLHQIIYQEIENNSGTVKGAILPKTIADSNTNATIPWSNLQAYYPMTDILSTRTLDYSSYGRNATLHNITTIQPQTAPIPYQTQNDGLWTTEGTWLNGGVQDISADPSGRPNSIVKMSHNITVSKSIKTQGLIIDDNKTLTVTGDNEINNSWYLELNGTIDLADDSQLVQGEKSDLVTDDDGNILRRQEGNLNYYWYNYWSSPVGATQATTNSNTGFSINMLKDTSGTPISFTSSYNENGKTSTRWLYKFQNGQTYWDWVALAPNSAIEPGVGYTQKGTSSANGDKQYIFEGKPNNGIISLIADDVDGDSANEHSNTSSMYNYTSTLIGNPYPSAIDAEIFISDNSSAISGAIYIWEQWAGTSHNLAEYQGGYGTINMGTATPAYQWNNPASGTDPLAKTPTRYIPVGQGFFVEVETDLGTIEFNNSQRVFKTENTGESVFFKNSDSENSTTSIEDSPMGLVRLEFGVSNGNKRNFALLFGDITTDEFDYGYDARTIDPQGDDMTSFLGDDKMVIQSYAPITNDKVVDLVFNSTGTYNYTLEIIEMENIPENQEVYLRDNLTNTYFDLRSGTYSFSSDFNGEDTDRFDIVFQPGNTLSDDEFANDSTVIYVNNTAHMLYVKGLTSQVKQLNITNILGQNIRSFNNINNLVLENGLDVSGLSSGVYLVNLSLEKNDSQLSKKIIIN